ncbi:HtaA domain-containing protein [Arcanobacterium phocae]|nr:HtaA domain-containing protein [Arcanobacterium phocae]
MRKMFVSTALATALMFANAVPAFAADQESGKSPVVAGASESNEASEAGPQTEETAEEPVTVQASPAATESEPEEKLVQEAPEKESVEEKSAEKSAVDEGLVEVKEAYANWDFRKSFREYVGIEGERLTGVSTSGEREGRNLIWSAKPGQKIDLSGKTGVLEFQGEAFWSKYNDILHVKIENPTIDFAKKELIVDGYTKGTMAKEGEVTLRREVLAKLDDLAIDDRGSFVVISSLKPTFTEKVKDLVGFYQGEVGAPFVVTVGMHGEKAPLPILWELFPSAFKNPSNGPVYSDDPLIEVKDLDPGLEKCIRSQYDVAHHLPITNKTMESIQSLKCAALNILSLEGLQYAKNLSSISFHQNSISDLSPLSGLQKLVDVTVSNNLLTSLRGLEKSPKIQQIDASGNYIEDVSPINGLHNITSLNFSNNRISNIDQLRWDTEDTLENIDLSHNRISDISKWNKVPFVSEIDLSHNLISDLGSLPETRGIRKLNIRNNFISDPSPFSIWAKAPYANYVQSLKIAQNAFTDWSPLKDLTKVKEQYTDRIKQVVADFPKAEEDVNKLLNPLSKDAVLVKHADQDKQLKKKIAEIKERVEAKRKAEEARKAEEKRKAEEARKAEEKRKAEEEARKAEEEANQLVKIVSGDLDWGVKESFRKYISGVIAQGKWELSEGATGIFKFPLKAGQDFMPSDFIEANFGGKVHFTGHHGLLDLTISHPTIKKENRQWKLYATVTSRPFDKNDVPKAMLDPKGFKPSGELKTVRAAIATLSEPERVVKTDSAKPMAATLDAPKKAVAEEATLKFATVTLTTEGAHAFSDFYDAGLVIDPITVTVKSKYVKKSDVPNPDNNGSTGDDNQTKPNDDQPKSDKDEDKKSDANASDSQTKPSDDKSSNSDANKDQKAKQIKKCAVDPNKKRITSGNLSWALRSSFTTYIRGSIAHGGWTLGGGASWDGANFNFPATGGLFNTSTRTGNIYYGGTVHFTGHDGILDMTISNPSIAINGNRGSLYMTVSGSDMSGKKFNLGRVNFATITFSGVNVTDGALNFSGASVNLTDAGAKAFAGFYKAGEQLAPMSSSVKLVPATACDPETGELIEYDAFGGNLAQTGLDAQGLLAVSILVLFAGMGMIGLRRRHTFDVVSGVDQK